jgi:hypothetical protein
MADFTQQVTAATCGTCDQRTLRIVCSPHFFETGGQGTSVYACRRCADRAAAVLTRRYGSYETHQLKRGRR